MVIPYTFIDYAYEHFGKKKFVVKKKLGLFPKLFFFSGLFPVHVGLMWKGVHLNLDLKYFGPLHTGTETQIDGAHQFDGFVKSHILDERSLKLYVYNS
jgi:hypothetical protein